MKQLLKKIVVFPHLLHIQILQIMKVPNTIGLKYTKEFSMTKNMLSAARFAIFVNIVLNTVNLEADSKFLVTKNYNVMAYLYIFISMVILTCFI